METTDSDARTFKNWCGVQMCSDGLQDLRHCLAEVAPPQENLPGDLSVSEPSSKVSSRPTCQLRGAVLQE